jgi:preprotein translocase subunit YajC
MAGGIEIFMSSRPFAMLLAMLAQSAAPGSFLPLLLPWILVMGIFYVLLIMPQQKRQKKLQEMIAALKAGDKVITSGGIYGTVVGLEDNAVQLRIADQVKIKVSRAAIAGLQPETKES